MSLLKRLFCCLGGGSASPPEDNEVNTPRSIPAAPSAQDQATPSTASCTTPSGTYKFMFDKDVSGRVIGINNSGSKYAADKPIETHHTPYEERIERAMQLEEQALARRREKGSL